MSGFISRLGSSAAVVVALVFAPPAVAATVQNGDFASGFDGWEVKRCSFLCVEDTTNSASVVPGADPYLELKAPSYIFGAGQIEARQSVHVGAEASQLSFDAALLSRSRDIAARNPTPIIDYFTLLLGTTTNLYSLFTYDANGAREAASNVLTGILSIAPTSLPNIPGAVSSYAFGANLSQFAGEEVTLYFITVSKDDERVTTFGIDNIALTGTPVPAVPLPAGGLLVLTALGVLAGLRRRVTRS